jgi:IS5 family transposase
MRRRAAVEPIVGHLKDEHPDGPQPPRSGDATNAILAAIGSTFSLCGGSGFYCG